MRTRNRRPGASRLIVLGAALAMALATWPVAAQDNAAEPWSFMGEEHRIEDADLRPGRVAPSTAQQATVAELGATARWNAFGTPHVLVRHGGYLATGLDADPERSADTARAWLRDNAALFRLSQAEIDALELVQDSALYDSPDLGWEAAGRSAPANPDVAHVVRFRQHFDGVPAGADGMVVVAIDRGRIVWVSSSLAPGALNTAEPALEPTAAWRIAAADVDLDVADVDLGALDEDDDWTTFEAAGFGDLQRARLVALPTPRDGVRLAWETIVVDGTPADHHPLGFIHFVDAVDGRVWKRSNRLHHFSAPSTIAQSEDEDDAAWTTFPAYPPLVPLPTEGDLVADDVSEDIRERWCWTGGAEEDCDRTVGPAEEDPAKPQPWDVDPRLSDTPTHTTRGNNADTGPSCISPFTPDGCFADRPFSAEREYDFAWTNQWYEESCNPQVFASSQRNDIDAATTSLFVGHNRVHDWGYYLGWTEENSNMQESNFGKTEGGDTGYPTGRARDPETGQSQAGYATGTGNPAFGRDNANQLTLPDGIPGVTNQYLWQPIASAAYVPCVDGAYDMAVITHEVGHAISNRMTDGPDGSLSGHQAGSMGESWSDLMAVEYLTSHGFAPREGENPYAVGSYVAGDPERGIRNHAMNASPLNYSNVEYDFVERSVHSNGEIWSGVHHDLREALMAKYDEEFPADDQELQTACAEGERPADECPGNRRWIQLLFDGFLLQPAETTMVDARDAILAADVARFGGANQAELWQAFSRRGLGEEAASPETTDDDGDTVSPVNNVDPIPDFTSPEVDNATVEFEPVDADGGEGPEDVQVFVGEYQARSQPIADTRADTDVTNAADLAPDTYQFLAVADGWGWARFTRTIEGDETIQIPMHRNLASRHAGAEVTSWDGLNSNRLIDDSEETNWASLESDGTASEDDDVEGRQVTVRLAGEGAQRVGHVQVSAMLRPTDEDDTADDPGPDRPPEDEPEDPPEGDTEAQNRFSALRSFQILACNAEAGDDCDVDEGFEVIFTSADDAFPATAFRPRTEELTLRPFDVTDTEATHVRLRVLANQCTGNPLYQGDLDNDPSNTTDCRTEAGAGGAIPPQGENVRAAMLQVLEGPPPAGEAPGIARLAGRNRVDTAVAVSQDSFPDGADTVVVARSDLYPDALAGAPLAFSETAPILVTPSHRLDDAVAAEINRLGADEAILLGGEAALSEDVEDAVGEHVASVRRVAGPDRFETAAAVAGELDAQDAYVTEGRHADPARGWPDAMSVAPLAAYQERPILLVEAEDLPGTTREALDGLDSAVVIGGEAAVSAAVYDEVTELVGTTERVSGADRYATSTEVAAAAEDAGMSANHVWAATGTEFVDALVGGPAVARSSGLFVLLHPEGLSRATTVPEFLEARRDTVEDVTIIGGRDAVPAAVEEEIAALLAGD